MKHTGNRLMRQRASGRFRSAAQLSVRLLDQTGTEGQGARFSPNQTIGMRSSPASDRTLMNLRNKQRGGASRDLN